MSTPDHREPYSTACGISDSTSLGLALSDELVHGNHALMHATQNMFAGLRDNRLSHTQDMHLLACLVNIRFDHHVRGKVRVAKRYVQRIGNESGLKHM